MKFKFILFIFFLGFYAIGQNNHTDALGKKQGVWEKKYVSGKTRYTGTFKDDMPIGTFTYYFEREGGVMSEVTYRKYSGVGYAQTFQRSGVREAEGIYNKQVKDSTWTYYSRAGVLTQ